MCFIAENDRSQVALVASVTKSNFANINTWDHSFSIYAKFSENLHFLPPDQGVRNVSFLENFAYEMNILKVSDLDFSPNRLRSRFLF